MCALYSNVLCCGGLYWGKMELCRRHIPSASLVETVAVQILVPVVPSCMGEAVQGLVLAEA